MKEIVNHLNRIAPHLKLYYEGEYFDSPDVPSGKKLTIEENISKYGEVDFAPPKEYDWFDVIKILNKNGLEIRWMKS